MFDLSALKMIPLFISYAKMKSNLNAIEVFKGCDNYTEKKIEILENFASEVSITIKAG